MSAAVVTADTREIRKLAAVLNGLALGPGDRRQLLTDLGAELEDQTKERFDTKRAPDGSGWKELSDRYREYLARRFPGAQPQLVVSGELRDTVETQASDFSVLVGATKVYAAVHQWGWPEKHIPARPYIGIDERNEDGLVDIANRFIERRVAKVAS